MQKPLVSVWMITYNHEKYIAQALESVLMQKTYFDFEIVIGEDCSTDGTRAIVENFENKYPAKIHAIYQNINVGAARNAFEFTMSQCKGKYIAMCEGDDYWTDPYKLQKQVDFLEANQGYSLCVGGFIQKNETNGTSQVILKNGLGCDSNAMGFTFTLNEMKKDWITKTLTVLFRKSYLNNLDLSVYKHAKDTHLIYHLVKNSKAFYFKEIFGVFRIHTGGTNSQLAEKDKCNTAYKCYKELYEHNGDEFTRYLYRRKSLGLLNYNLYNRYKRNRVENNFSLYIEAVKLTRSIKDIFPLFIVFIPRKIIHSLKKILGYPLGDG